VEIREDVVDQVKKIVKDSMEEALERIIPEVPFKVKPRVRKGWAEISVLFEKNQEKAFIQSLLWPLVDLPVLIGL
jgi:hypothetical protein